MESLRVLAVAHNETTLRLCLLGLGIEGMDVRHAPTLDLALELARVRRPEVVVLDTTIPSASGLTALRGLVGDLATSGVPVITLAERGDPGAQMAHWIAGASGTIGKPFSLDELSHTVRRLGHMSPERLRAFRDDTLARLRDLDRSPSPN